MQNVLLQFLWLVLSISNQTIHLQSATKLMHQRYMIHAIGADYYWRANKCVQRTMALCQYKLFHLFPFSVIEFYEEAMFKPWTPDMCDRKSGFFFLSCDSLIFLSDYDSVPYNMSE